MTEATFTDLRTSAAFDVVGGVGGPQTFGKNKKDGYRQLNVRQLGSLRPWDHRG